MGNKKISIGYIKDFTVVGGVDIPALKTDVDVLNNLALFESSGQSFTVTSANTYIKVNNFTTPSLDTANGWDNTNKKYVIQSNGYYSLTGRVTGSTNNTVSNNVRITVDGASRGTIGDYGGTAWVHVPSTYLTVGQAVELYTSCSVTSTAMYTQMWIHQIGVA